MMYSQANNLMAMLPGLNLSLTSTSNNYQPQPLPLSLFQPSSSSLKLSNVTNLPMTAATTSFNPYLLSSPPISAMPSKTQILAEMEMELQKLRFLESLLHTSPENTGCVPISPISFQSMFPYSPLPQPSQLQYPIKTTPAITPTSTSSSSATAAANFYTPPPSSSSTSSTPLIPKKTQQQQPSKPKTNKKVKKATSNPPATVSPSEERQHECKECNKRFKFKSNLFEHKSLHSAQQSYQYICPFCSKTCRLKGNLKKHLQIHMGTADQLEQFWKDHFFRNSGRPRKTPISQPPIEKIFIEYSSISLSKSYSCEDIILNVTD